MTQTNNIPFRLSKDELEKLLKLHNLGNLKYIKLLSKGIESSTFSLFTEAESYVLTLLEEKHPDISMLQKISHYFISQGFPLTNIVAIGKIANKQAIISSILIGKVKNNWDSADYESVGFLLGNLHKCASTLPITVSTTPFIWQLSTTFFEIQAKIPEEFQRLEQEIYFLEEEWPSHLPKGLIYGDLWHKNILFSDNTISGLLDFNPTYESYILDLANLIKGIPNKDPLLQDALLSGYQLVRPLLPEEHESLDLFLYAKILSTILYLLKKSLLHPLRKDEFQTYAFLGLLKLDSLAALN